MDLEKQKAKTGGDEGKAWTLSKKKQRKPPVLLLPMIVVFNLIYP